LKESTIQQVVSTGRGSVKFGKFMGAMALSVALTSLSYGAGAATAGGSPFFFYNVYTIKPRAPNVVLAHSADGQFIYALNTQTDDVTVVRVSNGKILDKIPVGGGCRGVDLAPGGQFVYTYARGEVSFIDTHTHKKTVAYKAPTGKVHAAFTLDADAAFVALTDQQLVMWSLETGQATRTISGFGEPFLLLDPRVR
jgi:DNA-binding beta-propeller fold protein YncE